MNEEDLYLRLMKIYGFLTDGRAFLAREELELLLNIQEEDYASTDPQSN
jgi:hypothetical protein